MHTSWRNAWKMWGFLQLAPDLGKNLHQLFQFHRLSHVSATGNHMYFVLLLTLMHWHRLANFLRGFTCKIVYSLKAMSIRILSQNLWHEIENKIMFVNVPHLYSEWFQTFSPMETWFLLFFTSDHVWVAGRGWHRFFSL